jgi:hypothetical protein
VSEKKCPLCGSQSFYVKDREDQYETYEFDLTDGEIIFKPECSESEPPDIVGETETYCHRCAWHGKFETLKRAV